MLPMLLMACFVSPAQRMVIAGLDFNLIRIMVLIGWIRIIFTGELRYVKLNKLDYTIILWSVVQIVIYTIQNRTSSALVYKLGVSFDTMGMYFLFRSIIREKKDIENIITYLAYISFPLLIFFILERVTGRNIFSIFGGVPEITVVREGRFRVQGAFAHPILGGCFWASILPLQVIQLLNNPDKKRLYSFSIISIFVLVVLTASSTPLLSIFLGCCWWFLYLLRKRMFEIIVIMVVGIIALDFIMEAPVYHLIARIDLTGGSTGWHRFNLINQAVINWKDWFLFGLSNIDYWGVFNNDVTNQYILEAIRGGALGLLFFLIVIIMVFRLVNKLSLEYDNKNESRFYWAFGVSFFMHISNFIAVSYFGQIWMLWYLCIGVIGSSYQVVTKSKIYQGVAADEI